MRSPFDLASITADASGGSGPSDFRIGGGKSGEYGITLDGVSASTVRAGQDLEWTKINTPSIDALTEFSVESGGFKAEFGHASGGFQAGRPATDDEDLLARHVGSSSSRDPAGG